MNGMASNQSAQAYSAGYPATAAYQNAIQPAKEPNISGMAQQLMDRAMSLDSVAADFENVSRRLLLDRSNKLAEGMAGHPEPAPQCVEEVLRLVLRHFANVEGRFRNTLGHLSDNI